MKKMLILALALLIAMMPCFSANAMIGSMSTG